MEIAGQTRKHSAIPAISAYLRLGVGIRLSALAAVAITVSGRFVPGRRKLSDSFSAVSDFFGGDARQVALARGFTCQNPDYAATLPDFCRQLNPDRMYSGNYAQLEGSETKEVDLLLRPQTLTLGDLVLLWGKPETRPYCDTDVVSWSTHGVLVEVPVPRTAQIDYFAPILTISFIRQGLPYWKLS